MGQEGSCLTESGVIRFLSGTLPGSERDAFENHLDTCSICPRMLGAAAHESGIPSGELKERLQPQVLAPGVILAGRYRVRSFLGSGAMGEVHEAEDQLLGTSIALKTLTAGLAGNDAALSRLKREVAAAHRVTHPNVCRVFDLGMDHGREGAETLLFLTMEYLPGTTLARYLQTRGPLPPSRALPLLSQLADGLAAAHAAGIIHRDLKPENVMLIEQTDGTLRAVITDFGLAGTVAPDGIGMMPGSGFSGTPVYAAPERLSGGAATSASDVYSFGLLAYETLSGRLPPVASMRLAQTIEEDRGLPAAWKRLLRRAVSREPGDRFANAAALVAALRQLAATKRPAIRHPLLAAALSVVVLAAGLGLVRARNDARPPARESAAAPLAVSHDDAASGTQMSAVALAAPPPVAARPASPPAVTEEPSPVPTPPQPRTRRNAARPRATVVSVPEATAAGVDPSLHLAEQRLTEGHVAEACGLGRSAAARAPQDAAIWEFLGRCHMRLPDPRQAHAYYRKYLALAPAGPKAAFIRAIVEQEGR
jgi:hypothetical protein